MCLNVSERSVGREEIDDKNKRPEWVLAVCIYV